MFKAYFPAAPMSKHEYTVALCPAKSLRPNKAVLIIMHRLESEPGAIGQYLQANGIPLDIRPAFWRYPAPHDAWFPMSANDPDRYIKEEIDWIGIPLSEGKPLLGICLGAQMLAKHLGGILDAASHRPAGPQPRQGEVRASAELLR